MPLVGRGWKKSGHYICAEYTRRGLYELFVAFMTGGRSKGESTHQPLSGENLKELDEHLVIAEVGVEIGDLVVGPYKV